MNVKLPGNGSSGIQNHTQAWELRRGAKAKAFRSEVHSREIQTKGHLPVLCLPAYGSGY